MDSATAVVFSDLDGTLFDHKTHDFAPALPALNRLRELDVPLVLVGSKTRARLQAAVDEVRAEVGCDGATFAELGVEGHCRQ